MTGRFAVAKRTNSRHAPQVEMWPIERVTPYEKNAKKHPKKQIEHLAKIIAKHGFDQPIVVDANGVVIKGHGRRLAAQHLKLATVPVVVRGDLTPAQVREARIADNKVAELGEWDVDILLDDVKEAMELPGFDLDVLGLNMSFINEAEEQAEQTFDSQFGVIVICADEGEQKRVFDKLQKNGLNCRVVVV